MLSFTVIETSLAALCFFYFLSSARCFSRSHRVAVTGVWSSLPAPVDLYNKEAALCVASLCRFYALAMSSSCVVEVSVEPPVQSQNARTLLCADGVARSVARRPLLSETSCRLQLKPDVHSVMTIDQYISVRYVAHGGDRNRSSLHRDFEDLVHLLQRLQDYS